jgi:hypothetical protein
MDNTNVLKYSLIGPEYVRALRRQRSLDDQVEEVLPELQVKCPELASVFSEWIAGMRAQAAELDLAVSEKLSLFRHRLQHGRLQSITVADVLDPTEIDAADRWEQIEVQRKRARRRPVASNTGGNFPIEMRFAQMHGFIDVRFRRGHVCFAQGHV